MRTMSIRACVAAMAVVLAWDGTVLAQLTAAQKCEKAKNIAAAKRAYCTAKERGKEIAGKPFSYTSCTLKMAEAFTKAETNAAGACPTTGDAARIEARISGVFSPTTAIPKALSGGVRWVDNGDGTVIDTLTGLQWEKKDSLDGAVSLGNAHDADNEYTWTATAGGTLPNGTAFTDFLGKLNNCSYDGTTYSGGFAGHCDWRLPWFMELQSLAGCSFPFTPPCFPLEAIFGPTAGANDWSDDYWTSSTYYLDPAQVWVLHPWQTMPDNPAKSLSSHVRAVRGPIWVFTNAFF